MNVIRRLVALAVVPVLGLFATVALADVSGEPDPSENASSISYFDDNEIKNARQCGGATFFKNAFPSLTNGTPGGATTIDFPVDGKVVSMTVTWDIDNSFGFKIVGGWASRVGVTVDRNNFVYEYASPTVGIDDPADGFTDSQLNYYGSGITADDVNHLDLCLETLDSTAPDVSIRVEPSTDGTTVFGTVSIIATVFDESLPDLSDLSITIISTDDGTDYALDPLALTGPSGPSDCDPVDPDCSEYTWAWDTSLVPPGEYTITVGALDTSALKNPGEDTIVVTVVTAAINCLEGDDGINAGEDQAIIEGCNPSGFQWVELPDGLGDAGLLENQTLTQVAVPALLGAQTDECGGPVGQNGERPYPFVAEDPRWDPITGYDPRPLDLSEVFDLATVIPEPVTGVAVMRADTRGEKCLALLYGEASFSFEDFYDGTVSLFGANRYTYAVTQLPETQELGLSVSIPADIGPLGPNQIDLQKVPEATFQPTDRFTEPFIGNQLGPFTNKTFNPQRAAIPEFSFFGLGTVQICESLLGTTLVGRPYYEAVLECSTDLAVEYFDDLDLLLEYVGAPSPNYPQACLVSPSASNLRVELNKARSMIKVGDWTKATTRLLALLADVEAGIWLVDDRNCPGHVVMRIENLLWRTEQLELAESLLPLP